MRADAFRLGSMMSGRHPGTALPAGSALSEPADGLDLDTAKAALDQVNKRLHAELALKSATETRALTLAGRCTTLLSALTAALLVESYGSHRLPLLAAGVAGGLSFFAAVRFAYSCAHPRANGVLPGCPPDELRHDLVAPAMKGPKCMGRLLLGSRDAMVQNETKDRRARSLSWAILMVTIAVPLAVAVFLAANALQHALTCSVLRTLWQLRCIYRVDGAVIIRPAYLQPQAPASQGW